MTTDPTIDQYVKRANAAWLEDEKFWGGGSIAIHALQYFKREVTTGHMPPQKAQEILDNQSARADFVHLVATKREAVIGEYDRFRDGMEKYVQTIGEAVERLEEAHRRYEIDKVKQRSHLRAAFKRLKQVSEDIGVYDEHLRTIKNNTSIKVFIGLSIALNIAANIICQNIHFNFKPEDHRSPEKAPQVQPFRPTPPQNPKALPYKDSVHQISQITKPVVVLARH